MDRRTLNRSGREPEFGQIGASSLRDSDSFWGLIMLSLMRCSRIHVGFVAFAVVAASGLGAVHTRPAMAQSSVKILVNDDPITTQDMKNRTGMLRTFSRGEQGEKEAIEQLIDERLMMQEAKRRAAEVSDEKVDEEFADRAKGAKLNADQFSQAMRQAGFDPETFKDFLRANMAWREIVRARFRATVKVTDQDVTAALTGKEIPGDEPRAYEYMLQQILFVVPEGAKSGVEGQRRKQADAFRGGFQGCDASLQQAGGAPGIVVKPTVRREESEMSGPLKEELAALAIGGISKPEKVDEGIQLVAVCAKKEIPGRTQTTQEVEEEITKERGQLLARRYLRDLRSDAVIEYR